MKVTLSPELKNKRICAAVSGGVDSIVLLRILKEKEIEYGYTLSAVNFEHGIRGEESVGDTLFVKSECEKLGVPLFLFAENCVLRAEKEKVSLETAARNFRQEGYYKLLAEGKVDYIATAHHQNDEAETVLFRILRGSSLTGAVGIEAQTNGFIRPLLSVSKKEILRYAKEHDISYREDKTNNERIATRNVLRLDILPALEALVPGAVSNIARFATLAKEDDEFLYQLSKELIVRQKGKPYVCFSQEKVLFRRACLTVMKELGVEKDYTATHLEDLVSLQDLALGAKVTLPKGVEARKEEEGIAFYKKEDETMFLGEVPFQIGEYQVGNFTVNVSFTPLDKALRFDLDKLPKDCFWRMRREGDRFTKFGGGTKSVKDYLIDKKIPVYERGMPLLVSGKDVLLISGVEISDKIKVSEETKRTVWVTVLKY